jgi:hypothetical protein
MPTDYENNNRVNTSWEKTVRVISVALLMIFSYQAGLARGKGDKTMNQYTALKGQYDRIETEYSALRGQYTDLKAQYDRFEAQRCRAAAREPNR